MCGGGLEPLPRATPVNSMLGGNQLAALVLCKFESRVNLVMCKFGSRVKCENVNLGWRPKKFSIKCFKNC